MIVSTILMSIIGIILFLIILLTFSKLLKKNESGFLHLLMAFMFACWLPIPITVNYMLRDYQFLVVGTIFGIGSLAILVLTMVLQASHLTHSTIHHSEDAEFWGKTDDWMLQGLLGGQVELLANVFKGIWVIFVTVCFELRGNVLLFCLGILFCLFAVAYLIQLINSALVNKIRFFKFVKLNFIVINLEAFGWFLLLTVWLVVSI